MGRVTITCAAFAVITLLCPIGETIPYHGIVWLFTVVPLAAWLVEWCYGRTQFRLTAWVLCAEMSYFVLGSRLLPLGNGYSISLGTALLLVLWWQSPRSAWEIELHPGVVLVLALLLIGPLATTYFMVPEETTVRCLDLASFSTALAVPFCAYVVLRNQLATYPLSLAMIGIVAARCSLYQIRLF